MNLLSNQVEPNFDESYDYRNPKLFQSQRSPSPKKESEEKDIPTEKTQQVINGIISDIAFGAIEAQKDSKSAKKTLTHLQKTRSRQNVSASNQSSCLQDGFSLQLHVQN